MCDHVSLRRVSLLLVLLAAGICVSGRTTLADDIVIPQVDPFDGMNFLQLTSYLSEWKAHFGSADATWDMGDANSDGAINLADLNIVKDRLSAVSLGAGSFDRPSGIGTLPTGSAMTSIPEPGTVALLAAGLLGLLACALRKRRC
jgi:hypothetical protein